MLQWFEIVKEKRGSLTSPKTTELGQRVGDRKIDCLSGI